MNKILLIGGMGFIGSHLALKLHELGNEVQIADSMQVNNLLQHQDNKRYRKFILERLDLLNDNKIITRFTDARDYHEVSRVVGQFKPDIVIHLAAVAHANVGNKSPHMTFDHSLRTLENALDAGYKTIKQFIYFSSSLTYGEFQDKEVTEETLLKPKGIYGALKVAGELIVKSYGETFGMPYTIIRPSALYGPRCVSRRVIQIFIENALAGKDLTIQGDGEEKLDFTYIDDLVQGVCLTVGNKTAYNETFNLTYGDGRSINEAAQIIQEQGVLKYTNVINGEKTLTRVYSDKIKYTKRDKLMPVRGTLSVDKAKRILGYKPEYPIEKGIKKYLEWYNDEK